MGTWKPFDAQTVKPAPASRCRVDLSADPLAPETLRELRHQLGLTRRQLAAWLHVKTRTVTAWEDLNRGADHRNCTGAPRRLLQLLVENPELRP